MKADSDEIRAVSCSFCGAREGQSCTYYSTWRGERIGVDPHASRIRRANGMLQERINQNAKS
jgi:hypothetical protein